MLNKGFTIVELLVVMGIFAIIASLTTLSLSNSQHSSYLNTSVSTLVTDLKRQQLKAMIGDTEGRLVRSPYGIHFESARYTLFHDTYSATDAENFIVNLDGTLNFTTLGDVNFAKGSGESSGLSTITIRDSVTGKQKSLTLNLLGVISAVN
jgi:prepilin-type N-terminal cleavage/methylation domain-containing protein